MKYIGTIQHPEDSFSFMRSLSFIGGFLNAYSYFARGGAFVTFHTGNLVRTGLSIVQNDQVQFWNSFTPVIAGFLGASISFLLNSKINDELKFQKRIILIEIISLSIIGFIWSGYIDNIVNFILSMLAMIQLSSFKKIRGTAHNTTIMTGNLRTLAQFFTYMIINRDTKSTIELIYYLISFLSFILGVITGGFLSLLVGNYSILICALILLVLFLNINKE